MQGFDGAVKVLRLEKGISQGTDLISAYVRE
jgi:hypothetical protein